MYTAPELAPVRRVRVVVGTREIRARLRPGDHLGRSRVPAPRGAAPHRRHAPWSATCRTARDRIRDCLEHVKNVADHIHAGMVPYVDADMAEVPVDGFRTPDRGFALRRSAERPPCRCVRHNRDSPEPPSAACQRLSGGLLQRADVDRHHDANPFDGVRSIAHANDPRRAPRARRRAARAASAIHRPRTERRSPPRRPQPLRRRRRLDRELDADSIRGSGSARPPWRRRPGTFGSGRRRSGCHRRGSRPRTAPPQDESTREGSFHRLEAGAEPSRARAAPTRWKQPDDRHGRGRRRRGFWIVVGDLCAQFD